MAEKSRGKALKVPLVTWQLALEAWKVLIVWTSPPLSGSESGFFQPASFWNPGRIISPLSSALWRSQDGSVQCWLQLHPVRTDTNSTGPTSVPLRLHPPPQPSTPIIFPGKQPEITHTGLQFEGFIETAAPVIIFQRLWISAGDEEPCRAEGKQVWLCLCDELNSG